MIEPILRFMVKFDLGAIPTHNPSLGPCWEWNAGKNHQGYAKFREGGRGSKTVPGHCFAYEYFIGKVPEGLQLDHQCDNKSCVNPWHLKPATGADNVFRAPSRNRSKTHCANGHEYNDINTLVIPGTLTGRSSRRCRICNRLRMRNKYRQTVGKSLDTSLFIGTAKLSDQQVLEIRKLCKEGNLSQKQIAKLYGVSQPHISAINTGALRANIDNPATLQNPEIDRMQ
jgi:hypothetical protein